MSDIQVSLKKSFLCNIGDLFDCVNQNIFGFVVFDVTRALSGPSKVVYHIVI